MSTGTCPACGSESIDKDIDEFDGVCDMCGFVVKNDTEQAELDWNIFDDSMEGDQTDWLRQARIQNATEQRIAEALDTLEQMADDLGVSSGIRKKVANIYCDAVITGTTDGREASSIIAACLRIASIQACKPIPEKKLNEFETVDRQKFRLCLTALQTELELQIETPQPKDYLPFVKATLDLNDSDARSVQTLLREVSDEPSLVGKDPAGIISAGVYLTQENRTQAEVSDVVGVSTETIRQRAKQLETLTHDG